MSVSVPYRPEHLKMAQELVAEMHRNNGLAPVDLDQFWADQNAGIGNPFGDIPQVPLGAILTDECVYAELGIEEDYWRYAHDDEWRLSLNKAYNDLAERIVGRRILSEAPRNPENEYPPIKELHDIFEAKNVWHDQSWWLMQSANTPSELEALIDRVEGRIEGGKLRDFILPEGWEEAKARLLPRGIKPALYRDQRGPITFATSIYGSENLIMLILVMPELAERFSQVILRTMLEIGRIRDEEAGYTPESAPHGFGFRDDNCCLMTPEMYELFGLPVLRGMFERYSPDPGDLRYQHSDSAMGHLLPLLARVGMNRTNFGPTILAEEIRQNLPNAIIDGQLAPFTYSRNEEENIVLEYLRDFEMLKETRGLVFSAAGSINNGTRLTSMRLVMAAIQRFGRYS